MHQNRHHGPEYSLRWRSKLLYTSHSALGHGGDTVSIDQTVLVFVLGPKVA